jgi:hypothetical protein
VEGCGAREEGAVWWAEGAVRWGWEGEDQERDENTFKSLKESHFKGQRVE